MKLLLKPVNFKSQVETVGMIYMAASGAPERTELHAQNVADVSLAMIKGVEEMKNTTGQKVEIRIGRLITFLRILLQETQFKVCTRAQL